MILVISKTTDTLKDDYNYALVIKVLSGWHLMCSWEPLKGSSRSKLLKQQDTHIHKHMQHTYAFFTQILPWMWVELSRNYITILNFLNTI